MHIIATLSLFSVISYLIRCAEDHFSWRALAISIESPTASVGNNDLSLQNGCPICDRNDRRKSS